MIKSKNTDDDDEDDEDEKEKQRKKSKAFESMNQTPSVKSFLSNIPAPKNSMALGALSSSSGTGRRSILEADVPVSNSNESSVILNADKSVDDTSNVNYESHGGGYAASDTLNFLGSTTEDYAYDSHGNGFNGTSNLGSASENYANYGSYDVSYPEYGYNYEQYENKWIDRSSTTEMTTAAESVGRGFGKRGRNDVPQDIIEVKQDELIKNRPREDQAKLTGIAFGPSYQVFMCCHSAC